MNVLLEYIHVHLKQIAPTPLVPMCVPVQKASAPMDLHVTIQMNAMTTLSHVPKIPSVPTQLALMSVDVKMDSRKLEIPVRELNALQVNMHQMGLPANIVR